MATEQELERELADAEQFERRERELELELELAEAEERERGETPLPRTGYLGGVEARETAPSEAPLQLGRTRAAAPADDRGYIERVRSTVAAPVDYMLGGLKERLAERSTLPGIESLRGFGQGVVGIAEGIPAAAGSIPGELLNVVSPPYDPSAIAQPGPQQSRIGARRVDAGSPRLEAAGSAAKEAAMLAAVMYPPLRPIAAGVLGAGALGTFAGTDDPREAGGAAAEVAGAGLLAKHSAPQLRAFADRLRPKPPPPQITGGGLPPVPPRPQPAPIPTQRALPGGPELALPDLTGGSGVIEMPPYSAPVAPTRPALPYEPRLALPPGTNQARTPSEVVFDAQTGELSTWVPGAQGQTIAVQPPPAPQPAVPRAPVDAGAQQLLRVLRQGFPTGEKYGGFVDRRSASAPLPPEPLQPGPYPSLGGAPGGSTRMVRNPAFNEPIQLPPEPRLAGLEISERPALAPRPYPPLGGAAAGSTRTRVRPAPPDVIDAEFTVTSQPYTGMPESPGRGPQMKRVFREGAEAEFEAARSRLGGIEEGGIRLPPLPPRRSDRDIIEPFEHKTELRPETYKTPEGWTGRALERLAGGNIDRLRAMYGLTAFDSNLFSRIGAVDLRRESVAARPRIIRDTLKKTVGVDEATVEKWIELERRNPVARDIPRKERAGVPLTPEEARFRSQHSDMYNRVAKLGPYFDEHRAKGFAAGDLGADYWPAGQEAKGFTLDETRAAEARRAGEFGKKAPEPKRSFEYERKMKQSTLGSIEAAWGHIKGTADKLTTDGELARLRELETKYTAEGKAAEAADLREWMKKVVLELPGDDGLLERALRQRGVANTEVKPGMAFDDPARGAVKVIGQVEMSDGPGYSVEINGQRVNGVYSKGQLLAMMYPDQVAAVKPGLLSIDGAQGLMARYFLYANPMPVLKASIFNTVRLGLSNNPRYAVRGVRAARDVAAGLADEATVQKYADLGLLEGVEGFDAQNKLLKAVDKIGFAALKPVDKYHRIAAFEASKSRLMEAHPEWPIDQIEAAASRIAAQQSDFVGAGLRSVRERDNWFLKAVNFFDRPQQRAWAQVAQLLRESARTKNPGPFIRAAGIIGAPAAMGAAMWDAAGADPFDGFMAFAGVPYVSSFFGDSQLSAGVGQKAKAAYRIIKKTVDGKELTDADIRRTLPSGMVKVGDLFSENPGRFFGRPRKEEK